MSSIKLSWPEKQVLDALDYSIDMSDNMSGDEVITEVNVSIRPSGELLINTDMIEPVSVTGSIITIWLTGGVPGRGYFVRMVVTLDSGREYDVVASLLMSRLLMSNPRPTPVFNTFSMNYVWTAVPQGQASFQGQGNIFIA